MTDSQASQRSSAAADTTVIGDGDAPGSTYLLEAEVATATHDDGAVGWAGYRRFWDLPGVPRLLVGFLLARLPTGAVALVFTLGTLQHTGSLALAGAVDAGYAVAMGIAMPVTGRAVDRRGAVPVLGVTGVVYPLALLLFAAVTLDAVPAPDAALVAVALLAGASLPPVAPVERATWSTFLDPDGMRVANALESLMIQAFYVVGPALVGLLALGGATPWALVLSAVLNGGGVALVASSPRVRAVERRCEAVHRLAALRQPGMVPALLLPFAFSAASVGADFVVITWAHERGEPGLAGFVMGVACVAGIAASAAYGAGGGWVERLAMHTLFLVWAAVSLLLAAAAWVAAGPVAVALAMCLFELPAAPLLALMLASMTDVAADGLRAESFSWRMSATMVGVSAGAAVCGPVAEATGILGPAVVAVGCALAAAVLAVRHPAAADQPARV